MTTDVVRLRLLNASPARTYGFTFADGRDFAMIASDGGLLEAPFEIERDPVVAGGARRDSRADGPGERVVLQSIDPDLGGAIGFIGNMGGGDKFDVLELRAAPTLESRGSVPSHARAGRAPRPRPPHPQNVPSRWTAPRSTSARWT